MNKDVQLSIAFKKSIAKDYTTTLKEWYEEYNGGGFNVHANDVWAESVPAIPPAISTPVVKVYKDGASGSVKLTHDASVGNNKGWSSGIKKWIPPKYGQAYTVKVYQDNGSGTSKGSQIYTTDNMGWFFDYESGYLSIEGNHSYNTPFWVEGYVYVGRTVSGGFVSESGAIQSLITQAGHGFVVGDVLKRDVGVYAKAQADSLTNAEVYGVVSEVLDTDTFVITLWGFIEGLNGLSDDDIYFLSETEAGKMSPSPGFVNKPVLQSTSETTGIVINMRGIVRGPNPPEGTSGYSGYSGWSGYSGEAGYSGIDGTSGYSGHSGAPGGAGISGYSGWSGYMGTSGYSGISGFSGKSGWSGAEGYSGASGYSGAEGASGFSGYSGVSGFSGRSGYSGASGRSGFSGTSGYSGLSGWSGESGISGESGYSGYSGIPGSSGYSGISGWSGRSGFSGYSGHSGYSGNAGDSGYSGYSGDSGYSGASGYSGNQGISGYSGRSGYSGTSGYSGQQGLPGTPGESGYSGWSGYSGLNGSDGSGISGYSGYSGISGFSGYSGQDGLKKWRRVFLLMGA